MKKIILTLVVCIGTCFALAGCNASQTSNEWKAQEVNNNDIYEFIDPDTGVHYWIYSRTESYAGMGGITPRLNSDGTVMITE